MSVVDTPVPAVPVTIIKDEIRQTLLSITRRYFSEEHNKRVEISRVNWQIRDLTRDMFPSR